jgi:hypothetical protein
MPVKQQAYFRYTRLEFNDSIRLLKIRQGKSGDPIHTSLSHETLDTIKNCYYALSYTWGTDSTARFIRVNGLPFCVQPNLRDALEAIRRPDQDLLIWVDAICLNQEDTQEKNHQVGQMGKIYEAAQSIYLWLGRSADGSESCFDYMNQDRKPPSQCTPIDPLEQAITALLSRPYWERAWIRQEFLLAQNIIIYCGDRITSWERFSAVIMCEQLKLTMSQAYELALDRQERALHEGRPQKPLMTHLMWYRPAECKDIRDRIFALLPLASNRDRFGRDFVDYTLDRYTIFLGMLGLHARPSFLTTVIYLQRHLETNFHKYMQIDNKLRISSSPMDGSSRIASSHRSKPSDETSFVHTIAMSEKCKEGSTNLMLSRSASGLRNFIAEVYAQFEKKSLMTRIQTSGLQSAICCLQSMNDCKDPSGGRGDYQQWVYPVPGTDIALQFHNPGPFFVLRRVLRTPSTAKLHQTPLQHDISYLPSDANFQALCDLTWFPDFLESVLSEHDPTTDPDLYPQDEMTGEIPSEADFIEAAMMILSCESSQYTSTRLLLRYGDSVESLVRPGSDMLRKIFTQIHQRHKVCMAACDYLLGAYGLQLGECIPIPARESGIYSRLTSKQSC